MNEAAAGRPVSFAHVEAALEVLAGRRGAVDAPGHRVQRSGSRLVLTRTSPGAGGRRSATAATDFCYPLSIPGQVELAEAACVVSAEVPAAVEERAVAAQSGRGPLALVRRDALPGPLAVRNRRPGDRFRPVGLGGRKKLQDYFVDLKVARVQRDQVPLVVDGSDRIVWVAGYGIDEAFRVTDPSQSVLLLRLKVGGGAA
jgi:tRNA(Ile)-lysidine synthase